MLTADHQHFQRIDAIARPITFLGSVIILLSILKSYIFYATFGIKITNYISFSEAILLFLNEIAVLALFLILLLALLALIHSLSKLKNRSSTITDLLLPKSNAPFFHKLICLALFTYPPLYLFYAIVRNVYLYGGTVMFYFLLICATIISALVILYTIRMWKYLNSKRNASHKSILPFMLLISIIFFHIWSLDRQLFLFHINKINKTVIAYQLGKPILITNRQVQLLGSTSHYIFCYDTAREVAVVIDASKFDSVEFGKYTHLPGFSVFDLLYH